MVSGVSIDRLEPRFLVLGSGETTGISVRLANVFWMRAAWSLQSKEYHHGAVWFPGSHRRVYGR